MNIPVLVLAIVFVLIAARRIGRFAVPMWLAMLAGALVVLASGQIRPSEAWKAIDFDVMAFLFGMFVVGQALLESGYLYQLAYRLFSPARSADALVLAVLFIGGLASAFLMNDTLAIVGTPLVLRLAHEHRLNPRLLLFALAFAVTIGSVMSPVGNPQNLIIASGAGLHAPFTTFFGHLTLPTLINLLIAYAVLRVWFRRDFGDARLAHTPVFLSDPGLARLAKLSLILVAVLILINAAAVSMVPTLHLRLSLIALVAAAPLLLSRRRMQLLRGLDWSTLVFFASLFVLVGSVWETGFFQALVTDPRSHFGSVASVMTTSVLVSQFISNVPLVALYLPMLEHLGASTPAMMALAAGSTIAGNLLVLGAASNVIIVQRAEKGGVTVGFLEFARIGVVLTVLNVLVYYVFLTV